MAGIERGVLVLVTLGVVCLVLERMDLGRVEEKAESGLTVPGVDAIVMLVVSTVREAAEERLRLFRDICLKTNFFSIKRKKKGPGMVLLEGWSCVLWVQVGRGLGIYGTEVAPAKRWVWWRWSLCVCV